MVLNRGEVWGKELEAQERSCRYFHINVKFLFITADSSAHNLCSEILIFFHLDVKPLDYALHIVPVTWFLFCISIVVLTEDVISDRCCDVLQGPNHTHSGDGHDKLMGFMKCKFPLTGYGLQDAYSGYVLYLKLWTSNSDPKLIGRWYLKTLVWVKRWDMYTGQC